MSMISIEDKNYEKEEELKEEEEDNIEKMIDPYQLGTFFYKILKKYNYDTENSVFKEIREIFGLSIVTAQIIDSLIYTKEIKDIVFNYDFEGVSILWKSPFPEAKIGDVINNKNVIGIFKFTIWVHSNEHDDHTYCCPSSSCCHELKEASDPEE